MMTRMLFAVLFAVTTVFSNDLLAQEDSNRHPLLVDRFSVGTGAFILDKEIKLRVNGQSPGDNLDVDERWGVKQDDSSLSAVFRWRYGQKWSLFGQYFETDDSSEATLTEDVHWNDVIFREGTNVGVGIDVSVARLFTGRTFSTGPNHEFGLGLGLHWLEIGAYIEGEIMINDESSGFRRESVSADAPLPNIGGWYAYAFSPKWMAHARMDWLYVKLGDYEGGLTNAAVGIDYQAFKHVGISLAYNFFKLDVDVDKRGWRGAVELQYTGPDLSLTANW